MAISWPPHRIVFARAASAHAVSGPPRLRRFSRTRRWRRTAKTKETFALAAWAAAQRAPCVRVRSTVVVCRETGCKWVPLSHPGDFIAGMEKGMSGGRKEKDRGRRRAAVSTPAAWVCRKRDASFACQDDGRAGETAAGKCCASRAARAWNAAGDFGPDVSAIG